MQYDFTLNAGGGTVIHTRGKYFKYQNGTGKIRVITNKGGYVDLVPGQGMRGMDFDSLTIKDMSGAANAGVILAGAAEFIDGTVSVLGGTMNVSGAVETSDLRLSRARAGNSYFGYVSAPATASQYSLVQFWNSSSDRNIVIESLRVKASVACAITASFASGPLTNISAAGPKKPGPYGKCWLNRLNSSSPPASAYNLAMYRMDVPVLAATEKEFVEFDPIVIPPLNGITIYPMGSFNLLLEASAHIFEDLI